MKKLRLFVFDKQNGNVLPRVPLRLVAQITDPVQGNSNGWANDQYTDGDADTEREEAVGILMSDHNGYISFDLSSLGQADIKGLWLVPVNDEENKLDIFKKWEHNSSAPIPIKLSARAVAGRYTRLPSVQNMDAKDLEVSPASYVTTHTVSSGEGGCEVMQISTESEQTYTFNEIVRKPTTTLTQLAQATLSVCERDGEIVGPLCYRIGAILEYTVKWKPKGHALGRVLYSLPLAPCESVKIAVVDWVRQDSAAREESVTATEAVVHNQNRDRGIEETIAAAASEWQRGGSIMGALAGGYSGAFTIQGSVGAAYNTSAGDKSVNAGSLQRIADAIAQASSNIRSQQSTVVIQSVQRETDSAQTRTVTNHNHCHAMTMTYYEVMRHFLVETKLSSRRDAIFIKNEFRNFDKNYILQNRQILRQVLKNQALIGPLNSIEHFDPGAAPTHAVEWVAGFTMEMHVTTGNVTFDFPEPPDALSNRVSFVVRTSDGNERRLANSSGLADAFGPIEGALFRVNSTSSLKVSFPDLTPDRIFSFGVYFDGEIPLFPMNWSLRGLRLVVINRIRVNGVERENRLTIYDNQMINQSFRGASSWWTDINPITADRVSSTANPEHQGFLNLLTHLNEDKYFYNKAIWYLEDPDARSARLEKYLFDRGDASGRLTDFIENRIIDIDGEYVVFPLRGAEYAATITGLEELDEQIISLPTRGAFAEGKLSSCSTCETIDDERFWDWQESPCDCNDLGIADVSLGSRNQNVIPNSPGAPGSVIGIQDPLAAPDPTGLSKVLEVLGKSDLFRDMSGKAELAGVMTKLVEGAIELQKEQIKAKAEQNKTAVQTAAAQPRTTTSPGATTATTSPTTTSATRQDVRAAEQSYTAAHQAISDAVSNGHITEEKANEYRGKLLDARINDIVAKDGMPASEIPPTDGYTPAHAGYAAGEVDASHASNGSHTILTNRSVLLYDYEPTRFDMRPNHRATLDNLVALIRAYNSSARAHGFGTAAIVNVSGYTDAVNVVQPTADHDLRLQRARIVANYLSERGITVSIPTADSTYISSNAQPLGRSLNRSVLVRFETPTPPPPPPPPPPPVIQRPPTPIPPIQPVPVVAGASRRWSLTSWGDITLTEQGIAGNVAVFTLRNLTTREDRICFFFSIGHSEPGENQFRVAKAAALRAGNEMMAEMAEWLQRLVRFSPSLPSETNFTTDVPVTFAEFHTQWALMMGIGIGAVIIGYGEGVFRFMTGNFTVTVDDGSGPFYRPNLYNNTAFINIGGLNMSTGLEAKATVGFLWII